MYHVHLYMQSKQNIVRKKQFMHPFFLQFPMANVTILWCIVVFDVYIKVRALYDCYSAIVITIAQLL